MSANPSVCPRCSGTFDCGIATGACWCADVRIVDATRQALADYYEGCLCRECLESLEAGRPRVPSVREFLATQLKRKYGRRA